MSEVNEKTHVYWIYGEGMVLLYVGITGDIDKRMRQHSEKVWWTEVRRIDTKEFATRTEARAVEAEAIRTLAPRYNRAHNGSSTLRRPKVPRANTRAQRRMVSVVDAAEYAAVSTKTIRRRIADGTLTGYRFGARVIRVDLDELDSLMTPIPAVEPEEWR